MPDSGLVESGRIASAEADGAGRVTVATGAAPTRGGDARGAPPRPEERDALARELDATRAALAGLQAQIAALRASMDRDVEAAAVPYGALLRSVSWRATRPLRAAVGLLRGDRAYWQQLREVARRTGEARPSPHDFMPKPLPTTPSVSVGPIEREIARPPLATFPEAAMERRLSLIVDSLNPDSMLGGAATALALAATLAREGGRSLRIATLRAAPRPVDVARVLDAHGIEAPRAIAFHDASRGRPLPIDRDDLFLTTSCGTTMSLLPSVDPLRVLCLVQEDERLRYPAGTRQRRCAEILAHPELRYVVNGRSLRTHLRSTRLLGAVAASIAFEPAFPARTFHAAPRPPEAPRVLLFHARPEDERSLFHRGVEALTEAVRAGLFPPDRWVLHCVGGTVPAFALPNGLVAHRHEALGFEAFAALIRNADLGLALRDTPEPSEAALQLAACGALAVTSAHEDARDLFVPHPCILTVEPSVPALVDALRRAVAMLDLPPGARRRGPAQDGLGRDWSASFAPVVDWVGHRFA